MTNEELQNIIDKLEGQDLKSIGTFGVFDTTHGNDFSIRANKEGLQLFALELFKASQQTKDILVDKEDNIIRFDSNAEWINPDSDIKILCVEQVDKKHEAQKVDNKKETFSDKSMKYGCFAILILLVIAMFVGLWTLGKWLF